MPLSKCVLTCFRKAITVKTERLNVWDGAQISAGTFGSGSSGILTVQASESIELSGSGTTADGRIPSGLFTSAESEATGAGGNLTVQTGRLSISDGAVVSASSQGSGDAGNLEVTARSILLDNQGGLTAETASGQGGNITLRYKRLQLAK